MLQPKLNKKFEINSIIILQSYCLVIFHMKSRYQRVLQFLAETQYLEFFLIVFIMIGVFDLDTWIRQ